MPVSSSAKHAAPDVAMLARDLLDPLLRFVSRRVGDRGAAEDIVQEVMLRLHRHADDIPSVESVSGWMYRIARNAVTDYYRAAVRRETPIGDLLGAGQEGSSVADIGSELRRGS